MAKPTILGKWLLPDGLILNIEGANGLRVEVGYLSDFGFKPGFHSHRDIKENPDKPGNYTYEVLCRFRGGRIDGWRAMSFTLKDANTISTAGGDWKRAG